MNTSGDAQPDDGARESQMLERMRRGDEAAFESFVREFAPRVLAVTRRFLRNEQDVQDAVQETFLSAFRALPRFRGEARLGTWLHRIAVNQALMRLRTAKRRPERPIEELLPHFDESGHMANSGGRWSIDAQSAAASQETRELVRTSIADLPETHRTVLLLRDIEEFSTEKTAELLGVTPGAVKTRLHRARQALRTLIDRRLRGETT